MPGQLVRIRLVDTVRDKAHEHVHRGVPVSLKATLRNLQAVLHIKGCVVLVRINPDGFLLLIHGLLDHMLDIILSLCVK